MIAADIDQLESNSAKFRGIVGLSRRSIRIFLKIEEEKRREKKRRPERAEAEEKKKKKKEMRKGVKA